MGAHGHTRVSRGRHPRDRRTRGRAGLGASIAVALVAGLAAIPASAAPTDERGIDRDFDVEVVSSPADMVTAGGALVRIAVPRNVPPHQVSISLDGRDVSDGFQPLADGRVLLGRVDGLALGANEVTVAAKGQGLGRPEASLTLVNHPAEGPVFSGPHIPLYCTAGGPPWNLGSVDEHCHVEAPTVTYQYRTTQGSFAPLAEGDSLPDDVSTTTTTTGETVPYVIRIERGTINRAVYETALLHEPGTPVPDPWTQTPGWNGRLVYTFGGACGIGHTQATSTGGVLNDTLLRGGYAVASATFNVFANNCNDVTSAETAMMVKEHFIETYGVPDFTMGWGGSAGTMQQLLIANAYPGILDGVIGSIGYPDERSTTVSGHECRFIMEALTGSALDWSEEQGRAVTGFARFSFLPFPAGFGTNTCLGYMFFDGVDYPTQCPTHIPLADRWDPIVNPDGIRCAIADFASNVYGTDPQTGYGRPMIPDTVGVQYGLRALEDGVIDAEQFVDLNERIGGLDVDGNRTTERTSADPDAVEIAYATGRVNQFDGGLSYTPIIETRGYTDLAADFHDRIRSWSMRERLVDANDHADNHVSWVGPSNTSGTLQQEALAAMDAWLTARADLAEQAPALSELALTRESRPDGLADGCLTSTGERIDEPLTLDPDAQCNELYPFHGNPRIAAGGPTSSVVVACQLTTHDREAYPVELSDEQWTRLEAVFPDGVCDWSQPGLGQTPLRDTWVRF